METDIVLYSMSKFESLKSDRRGVTALEYAVVAAVVIGAVVVAFDNFGTILTSKITALGTTVAGAT